MTVTASDLVKVHTKVLLNALRMTRAYQSGFDRKWRGLMAMRGEALEQTPACSDDQVIVDDFLLNGRYGEGSEVTVAQLKEELAKRPHVPNKVEGQKTRRERAKQGRSKGRRDR